MTTNKTKICILLPTHWAARMGGSQYQAKILVDYLIATGKFEILYLARRVNEDFKPTGYRIIKIPGPSKVRPSRLFETSMSLLKILKEISPDVIYQQVGNAYTGIAAYYARHNNCRMVWRVTSDNSLIRKLPKLSYNMIYDGIDKAMMAYGIRNASAIIVQTPHQGKLLEQQYKRKADAVVRNFHPFPEEDLAKSLPVKVLWIANFKKLKQPEIFVNLARDMIGHGEAEFIMVGTPAAGSPWYVKLADEIKSISNLKYTGPLPQESVNQLIANSHILINTSQYEGFSNTFIQAWMRKVPVISLNVNPDDIFNNHEIGYCAEGDYTRLLNYTKLLVNDAALLQKMADHARQYAYEFYSLRNIEQIVDILAE